MSTLSMAEQLELLKEQNELLIQHNEALTMKVGQLETSLQAMSHRLKELEKVVNPGQAKAIEQLSSLTTLQAAIMQMYLRDKSGASIDSRLGCSSGSARQLKRRISQKIGAADVTSFKLNALAITNAVSDDQYLDATGIPKNWFELYASVDISKDPFAQAYTV